MSAPHRVAVALISSIALVSVGVGTGGAAPPPPDHRGRVSDEAARSWTRHKIARMSLEEKVGQLFVTYAYGRTADTAHPDNRAEFGVDTPAEVVRRYHLGGVIHFSWTDSLHEPKQIAELSNGLQHAAASSGAGIPLTISTDQEQGLVTRIGPPATQLPGNMALGAGRSADAAEQAAAITGRELRAMGLTRDFAPVGDVNVNPLNPVIGVRSFSSDPQLAARLTAAQVRGYQDSAPADETVSSAVKHFPGHGDTSVDSHTSLPVIDHTHEEWERLDAPPFRQAIAENVDSVMTAHIKVPKLDDSGEPATLSPKVLTGMLREELGYDGVIITDSLQMDAVQKLHSDAELPVLALKAGADQLLMPQNLSVAIDSVLRAVRSGEITERRIDASVERVLMMKLRRGVITDPFVDVSRVDEVVGAPEHRRAAQRITDDTITLLRDDAGLLPLAENPGRMLVTGRGEQATATLAEKIRQRGPETSALATGSSPGPEQIHRAVERAKKHDVTVVLTNAAWTEEHASQRDLLRALRDAGVRVVAVAVRDPYDAAYVDRVRTWLSTYSSKAVSMESLARVLFGEIAPTGKLPAPVPDPDHPGTNLYPFGHGLTWRGAP
ncbi:beta-N-acetylhexosaminidase [Saccharopolyspora lacisalsi]|uniref:beta-N-acetylhexosaminidase n=1 Tax=Halosaccharopolyspora lacisalsi TaxID=1000566 RepID=A0A839E3B9_9PSEU|nr:glycoside hydrolase family 3 protein [Halosaccharopolyspora lacisalsi]MBA8827359.1 beta-N-acetylhexosaminidase [Halosaccharopolyspora lacisalsi]